MSKGIHKIFTAAPMVITGSGNTQMPSAIEWINKSCDIHTMEYNAGMKMNYYDMKQHGKISHSIE